MFNIINKIKGVTEEKETNESIMQRKVDASNPTLAEILKLNSEEANEDRKYTNAINTDYLD